MVRLSIKSLFIIVCALVLLASCISISSEPTTDSGTPELNRQDKGSKGVKSGKVSTELRIIGWSDQNKDGINDLFQDANGDGINDVTKKRYDHKFIFKDANKDGINDIFVDRDGDGVNDISVAFMDRDRNRISDNVLDYDGDGINDVTGVKYKNHDLGGYRFGIVIEELKLTLSQFVDQDGDGKHDHLTKIMSFSDEDADGINDRFIDSDGDGVCDGRRLGYRGRRVKMMTGKDANETNAKGSRGWRWQRGKK